MSVIENGVLPAVQVKDIIQKFDVSPNTAKEFFQNKDLNAYRLTTHWMCERDDFDKYINYLNDTEAEPSAGSKPLKKREPLRDTLAQVAKAEDIQRHFSISKATARNIMMQRYLYSYYATHNIRVCEVQYFLQYIEYLKYTGGLSRISFSFGSIGGGSSDIQDEIAEKLRYELMELCDPADDYERIMGVIRSGRPFVLHRNND